MPSLENVTDEQIKEFCEHMKKEAELIVEAYEACEFVAFITNTRYDPKRPWELFEEAKRMAEEFNIPEEKRHEFCKKYIMGERFYGRMAQSKDFYSSSTSSFYSGNLRKN